MKKVRRSKTYSTRFDIDIEKRLRLFCTEHDLMPSEVLEASVECLLNSPNCQGKKALLEKFGKGKYSF